MITLILYCVVILILFIILSRKVDIRLSREDSLYNFNIDLMLIGFDFKIDTENISKNTKRRAKLSLVSILKILKYVFKKSNLRINQINIFSKTFHFDLHIRLYALINSLFIYQYYKYKKVIKRGLNQWLKTS